MGGFLDCMHFLNYFAYMTQVTIRQVQEEWVTKAKSVAAEKGISMNSVLVDALKKGLEVEGKTRRYNLDRFAGDSPDDFGASWDKTMEVFEVIDEET